MAGHLDGLVQDCSNSSALAMELLQSYTEPSIRSTCHIQLWVPFKYGTGTRRVRVPMVHVIVPSRCNIQYFNGLMQERCNSIANALELRLSCTNPSICHREFCVSCPSHKQKHQTIIIIILACLLMIWWCKVPAHLLYQIAFLIFCAILLFLFTVF